MQQDLKELIIKKDILQKQISKLTEQIQLIDKTKNFDKGVVDREGFPRQDIDFGQLANYRNLKRKRNQLNNDHFALMKEIQSKLFLLHQTFQKIQQPEKMQIQQRPQEMFKKNKNQEKNQNQSSKNKEQPQSQKSLIDYLTPFAQINLVQENSPAQKGGIKVGDLLSQFAQVMIYTPDNIKTIPRYVKQNCQIKIVLMRPVSQDQIKVEKYEKVFFLKDKKPYAKIQLMITPAKWEGRGLLGCKIDPIK